MLWKTLLTSWDVVQAPRWVLIWRSQGKKKIWLPLSSNSRVEFPFGI
jgi:hypothetical protein